MLLDLVAPLDAAYDANTVKAGARLPHSKALTSCRAGAQQCCAPTITNLDRGLLSGAGSRWCLRRWRLLGHRDTCARHRFRANSLGCRESAPLYRLRDSPFRWRTVSLWRPTLPFSQDARLSARRHDALGRARLRFRSAYRPA